MESHEIFHEHLQAMFDQDRIVTRPDMLADLWWRLHSSPYSALDEAVANAIVETVLDVLCRRRDELNLRDAPWINTLQYDVNDYDLSRSNELKIEMLVNEDMVNILSIKDIAKALSTSEPYDLNFTKVLMLRLRMVGPDSYMFDGGW